MKVVVRRGNFEKAIRQFKRKTIEEGTIFEVRERGHYEKPSDKRRKKHKAAVNRNRRTNDSSTRKDRKY